MGSLPFAHSRSSRLAVAAEPWLSWVGLATVVLASLGLGRLAGGLHVSVLLGAVILVAAAAWPPLGGAALIAGALVSPFAIGTGTQTSVDFPLLLAPVLLVFTGLAVAWRRDWHLLSSRPVGAVLAFAAAAVLAFAASHLPWLKLPRSASLPAQLGALSVFVFSAGIFVFAARAARDPRWLARLTALFLSLGALYLVGRVLPPLGRFTGALFQPGADGSFFWTWLVVMATGQAAFNHRLPLAVRCALAALVCLAFYVVFTQSRDWASGWIPPLIAGTVVLCIGAPRLIPVAAAAAGLALALQSPRLVALVMSPDNLYSLSTRLAAWWVMLKIIGGNPVLGLGPANYYHYTPHYSILGWHVPFSSHNNYLDIAAQTGVLGLGCFFWFVWEVARRGWELRLRTPAGFARAYVFAALGGLGGSLAAAMLGDWMLPFVYNVTLQGFRASVLGWFFLGALVGTGLAEAREGLPLADPNERAR